jgi:hypothetical protein
MTTLKRLNLKRQLLRHFPEHEHAYIERAFEDDADAGETLSYCMSHQHAAALAVEMFRVKMPRTAYGRFLEAVWSMAHVAVIEAAQTQRTLYAMFRYAAYGLDKLPEGDKVRIYRGTSGVSEYRAASGHSWTTDRGVAAFFATIYRPSCAPLVIAADVPREDVLMYTNGRGEAEVLLEYVPRGVHVIGTPEEWSAWAKEWNDRKNASQQALLKAA